MWGYVSLHYTKDTIVKHDTYLHNDNQYIEPKRMDTFDSHAHDEKTDTRAEMSRVV